MLKRTDMSLKAKGLLSYLLSLPNDWKLYKTELQNNFTDGKDSVNSAFNELIKHGYITTDEKPKVAGKFDGYDYTVSDEPMLNRCGFTAAEKPAPENPQLLIEDIQSLSKDKHVELSPSDKCKLFIDRFNKIRNSKYQATDKICNTLKERIKKYPTAQIFTALRAAMATEYHRKTKFKYLTPEFMLRVDKLELYLNAEPEDNVVHEQGYSPAEIN